MYYCSFYGAADSTESVSIMGEATPKIAEACLKIRSIFDAGVPFYTKDAIREICQQIEKSSKKGQKISVRALDGVHVDFEVHTGQVLERDKPDTELVVCVYHCPQFKTTRVLDRVTM
jgi:hypothetical protein